MTQTHVDTDVLSELKEMLEDEFVELIQTFLQDTQSKLIKLSSQLDAGNAEEVRKLAHSIKGSSINLGIADLSALCSNLERAALEGDLARCQLLLQQVKEESGAVSAELIAMIN